MGSIVSSTDTSDGHGHGRVPDSCARLDRQRRRSQGGLPPDAVRAPATGTVEGLERANRRVPQDHGLPACAVHVPVGLTRPTGPTLQVNSRPDCKRPVHVHATSPRGEQLTLWTANPCLLITPKSSASGLQF